jgi:hypothetical protein
LFCGRGIVYFGGIPMALRGVLMSLHRPLAGLHCRLLMCGRRPQMGFRCFGVPLRGGLVG